MASASELKVLGVQKYKDEDFKAAINLFERAAQLEPETPVYRSNLSAAQFEDGQYEASYKTCAQVLSMLPSDDAALRPKILARQSKAASFLAHEHELYIQPALDQCDDARKNAVQRQCTQKVDMASVNRRLASLPRYRQSPQRVLEYYTIGHDPVNSLMRGPRASDKKDDEVDPLRIRIPTGNTPFHFSTLFCGIGDARHLFGTLIDVGDEFGSKTRINQDISFHFTLIDIHPAALARDLIIIFTLKELSQLSDTSSARYRQLLMMLHYVYWASVMPPLAREALDEILDRVHDHISKAHSAGLPLSVGWLYVEPGSCEALLARLDWWKGEGKTILSFNQALRKPYEDSNARSPVSKEEMESFRGRVMKENFLTQARTPEGRAQIEAFAARNGQSYDEFMRGWEEVDESIFNKMRDEYDGIPDMAIAEFKAYKHLRVLVPPPQAGESKSLEKNIFRPIRMNKPELLPPQDVLKAAHMTISKTWLANYTLLAKDWMRYKDEVEESPFRQCDSLFPFYLDHLHAPVNAKGTLYEVSARFFSLVAQALRRLDNHVTIEVIVGDGFEAMEGIRLQTLTRQADFPTSFDRIHLSNVPDYAGGFLSIFSSAIPLLKPHELAYVTSCDLLHANIWEGGMFEKTKWPLSMSSRLYTYAGTTFEELTPAFGVQIRDGIGSPVVYLAYSRVTNPGILSRDAFAAVSTACFLRTVLPATYSTFGMLSNTAINVREVANVHNFFRTLEVWKNMGYPSHILAELVERILDNNLTRSATPHSKVPAPLTLRQLPLVACMTYPFITEFEVAAALWEPRLFPIASARLPSVKSTTRYSIQIQLESVPSLYPVHPNHMVLMLVFGLPKDLDATSPDPRETIVSKAKCSSRSSLQFVSTFDYDPESSICTVLLTSERSKSFVDGGYEVAMINTVGWKVQSNKVPCSRLVKVGDADSWDRSVKVPKSSKGRPMTEAQHIAWMKQFGPGGFPRMRSLFNAMSSFDKDDDGFPPGMPSPPDCPMQ